MIDFDLLDLDCVDSSIIKRKKEMKAAAKANPMDTLRQLPENKKCFDCQQKVMNKCFS